MDSETEDKLIQNLPRLMYIGDVPVESTVAGSALIYRLLQDYPVDRLCIVEGNIAASQGDKRLPDVTYRSLSVGIKRLLSSRFVFLYTSFLFLTAKWRSHQLNNLIKTFKPEAILTVAHGLSWITAAELARKHDLPLHLIIHDEWTSYTAVISPLKDKIKKVFGDIYRQSDSQFCVSPYMREYYEKHYGVKGIVLYPSRSKDIPVFKSSSESLNKNSNALLFAYAGSINSKSYANSLINLAKVLEKFDHKLIIYSPLSEESIQQVGLNRSNVTTRPLIPSEKLIYTLRQEADVLFVPMSFDENERPNMEMSFPSKLTDYTGIGLPLLIWGPNYCSAVRWARENLEVAEVVETKESTDLLYSIEKLTGNLEYRRKLANNSLIMGFNYFSHSNIIRQFYQSLVQTNGNFKDK